METCPKIKQYKTMKLIISNLIRNVTFFLSNSIKNIGDWPYETKKFITKIKLWIYDQFIMFEDIVETNIGLGKQHLHNGDIKDAILRFKIVRWLFDKENEEVHYYLGWCYFLTGDKKLALENLSKAGKYDDIGLKKFVENPQSSKLVPHEVWHKIQEYRLADANEAYFATDFYKNPIEIPVEFVNQYLFAIQEMNPKAKILDLGAATGLVGVYLDHKISANYNITALDEHSAFLEYMKELRGERGAIYDNVEFGSLHKIKNLFGKKKYDHIFSFNSLKFTQDLSEYFKAISNALEKNGCFAIMLPLAKKTEWSEKNLSYVYEKSFIEKQLKLAKFDIVSIKEWSLYKKGNYVSFICKK